VSTDPAHSLGDLLGVRLGATPRNVRPGVSAVELDAPRAFRRWLKQHRRALADILERGTWLDRHDVAALLDLTIPGVDELAGLIEISALATGPYAQVIVDTAPTGHTLRLLAAPAAVTVVADVLDALQEDHRIIQRRFARLARRDAADRLVELLAQQAADVAALLRDHDRTTFHWVTLPEALAVAETEDGLRALTDAAVRVADIIVNRVWPAGPSCGLCDRRRAAERDAIERIRGPVRIVANHGKANSDRDDRNDTKNTNETIDTKEFRIDRMRGAAQLILVGGKGGVGKSTVAAALALQIAHADPTQSVLLLSTDPAHSLGDVFAASLGDRLLAVPGGPANLLVRELDAVRSLAEHRAALAQALDEVGEPIGAGASQAKRLIDLAPPGIDELFGMLSILEARSTHRTIVVDMAPTGHALRLLEMPETAREWVQTLLRVLLKYKAVVRPGRLAAELVEASQAIRRLQAMLRDASATRFLVVTRAEAPVLAETERLLRRLRAMRLATPAVVVNARTLAPTCRLCRATAVAERRQVRALSRIVRKARLRDCAIIQTSLAAPPPRGAESLDRWAHTWIQSGTGRRSATRS
jgi:arsenite/tail-anchored protein-transporting ATPase